MIFSLCGGMNKYNRHLSYVRESKNFDKSGLVSVACERQRNVAITTFCYCSHRDGVGKRYDDESVGVKKEEEV